jgi:MFS family permease
MSLSARLILLAALSVGAFLVGVELMITAVALPQILNDVADWTQLRRASWIINGYLLAYVATMPLAGRAADRFHLPTLFALALGLFAVGSLLCGAAQDLDGLIAARVVQGVGAGAILPLATAGAGLLFDGPARARAIGVVGAVTFLGMAAGPFLGATILQSLQLTGGGLIAPAWRWIFYAGAPFALLAALYTWAAAPRWQRTTAPRQIDVLGAALFTTAVATGLLALTQIGEEPSAGGPGSAVLALVSLFALSLAVARFALARHPFLELRFFANRTFSGAVVLSLLTGYALATALIGGAVFIDRVRYGLADEQQIALGALAGTVAIGALGSGLALRRVGVVPISLLGLAASIGGLLALAGARPDSPFELLVGGLATFGFGFGLTITARSTAAIEALGSSAFGLASAAVTVARMVGMAIGLAALTGFGSRRIESLSLVLVDQQQRDAVLPEALHGRPLQDYLVVDALEAWAAREAATILAGLFLIAAVVTAIAILPTLAMGGRGDRVREESPEDAGARAGVAI